MFETWTLALVVVGSSVGSALLALMLVALRMGSGKRGVSTAERPPLDEIVFLFDDEMLVDATAPARALLDAAPMGPTDWSRLSAFLVPRFADFVATMSTLADRGRIDMIGLPGPHGGAPLQLRAEDMNGLARITLVDPDAEGHGVLVDSLSHRAMEDELSQLRGTIDRLPVLAWRENAEGVVVWANRAYILRTNALDNPDDVVTWPLPKLFDLPPAKGNGPRRTTIPGIDDKPSWFECHSYDLPEGARLYFALPADATVRAERALREFVQTLTKTFADLPIGLAIFDRQRQLQLFNPALVDLMQLGADFLSARPTLYAFLDRLREARMMPEPKDYRSWRQQMTVLEQAAAAGHHVETWSLPGGQTYRVTGRPHPDGAVAFLFEDITAEVSLTQRFHAEIEMGQEVLDALDQAVAVFLPSGELVNSNAAYARLWGSDPGTALGQVTVFDATRTWSEKCERSGIWSDVRDFAHRMGERQGWSAETHLRDGRRLLCRFVPLSGGATLASFTLPDAALAIVPPRPPQMLAEMRA
ncbi:PAS-domain containing protein [Phaeovulum vinaykumarii]|uniref:PAS fold n=1 Tax=Phaeovulum vinaykumarii TaxID=407234 RepID=A0A1N7K9S3_9RHOB|nr:PAS-domain containing protein [Phaeovulum vinaykumarii]SIS58204.1 PAS fold [Phaeovulum vinaykumarii]SOB93718.1 PAS domain-containing protein [Phaeovulum vinaykumarii]